MNLYLVRHAVAFEHGDPAYPDDDERPLTAKGRRQFSKAAAGFLALVEAPVLILTSPLPRATQTAELLQAEAGSGTRTVLCDALRPGGSFEQVLHDCAAHAGGLDAKELESGLALVGHAPALGMLGAWLLAGDSACFALTLAKGGIAAFTFDGMPEAGHGDLRWLTTPRMLRSLA
jgi:phosphohistidine phosphatase